MGEKVSQYTQITTLATGDLIEITQDTGAGSYATKSITYQNLLAVLTAAISSSDYFKAEVLITSGSISGSSSDQAVPSLTYTIPSGKDGDYVFYAVLSVDIAGTDMKPLGIMFFKNGVKETNSVTVDFAKKNENQSVQLTYAFDGLVATDVISVYVNNDNVDINTIISGRIIAQKFA